MGQEVVTNVRGTADVTKIEAPITLRAYLICAFAAFGGIFFGYDIGWMSGVLAMPYFIKIHTGLDYDFNAMAPVDLTTEFAIPSSDKSLMTSILSLGTFLGALIAGDIAELVGRRSTIIIGCGIFIVGVVFQVASSSQLALMVVGRLIAGAGVGFESAVIILYMGEISPKRIRGAVVSAYQFCITLGLLIANCVVYGTQSRSDSGSYRIPIAVQFIWALILGGGLFFLPESPRYYVKKGRLDDARKALAFVRSQHVDSTFVQDELAEIIANHEYESLVVPDTSYVGSWLACFKGSLFKPSSNIRRTILGTGIQAAQQLTGVNFVFYYGTSFFQQLGTIDDPFLISLVTSLVNLVVTPLAFWTIERFGRRVLFIWGSIGMFFSQFIVAAVGMTAGRAEVHNQAAIKAVIAFICIEIFAYATTWGPAAWVIVGEIFPLPIRARGVAISTASCWFWNCVVSVIAPYMTGTEKGAADWGTKVFYFWGILCATGGIFAYFMVPEMKGLSLEQVDRMLEETTLRKSAQWVPTTTFAAEMGHASKNNATEEEVAEKSSV